MSMNDEVAGPNASDSDLDRLKDQVLARWRAFPPALSSTLDSELSAALEQSRTATPELMTVMNPVSRPTQLKLGLLVTDAGLDTMYAQEWGELCVSDAGCLYLVYRRRDGNHYAIVWTPATTLPPTMMACLSPALAAALLEQDTDDETT